MSIHPKYGGLAIEESLGTSLSKTVQVKSLMCQVKYPTKGMNFRY